MFEIREIINPWEGKMEPFKIIENVYFAGTFQTSVHLIDTGDGLIMIDTGYINSFYLVLKSPQGWIRNPPFYNMILIIQLLHLI